MPTNSVWASAELGLCGRSSPCSSKKNKQIEGKKKQNKKNWKVWTESKMEPCQASIGREGGCRKGCREVERRISVCRGREKAPRGARAAGAAEGRWDRPRGSTAGMPPAPFLVARTCTQGRHPGRPAAGLLMRRRAHAGLAPAPATPTLSHSRSNGALSTLPGVCSQRPRACTQLHIPIWQKGCSFPDSYEGAQTSPVRGPLSCALRQGVPEEGALRCRPHHCWADLATSVTTGSPRGNASCPGGPGWFSVPESLSSLSWAQRQKQSQAMSRGRQV